jgi:hypothetical protein
MAVKRVRRADLQREAELYPEQPGIDYQRPRTRGECEGGIRPCPFVSCTHHLYLEVTRIGSIRFPHSDAEPADLHETCALDVADRGGMRLDDVAALLNVTREAVRLVELQALARAEAAVRRLGIAAGDFAEASSNDAEENA